MLVFIESISQNSLGNLGLNSFRIYLFYFFLVIWRLF